MKRLFIWAHRGASAVAPENTMPAFEAALAQGADGIELDIHLSRDGVPVIMHDETVDRTTDGHGRLAGMCLQELLQLDAGGWFDAAHRGVQLPTLMQVLDRFAGRLRLNLEVKEAQAGLTVIEMLKDYPAADVVISSFNRRLLRQLRAVEPALPLAVLTETRDWHRALQVAVQVSACAFHPRVDLLTRPMLQRCRVLQLPVVPWTVDDPRALPRLDRLGVAGLFTNDPEGFR